MQQNRETLERPLPQASMRQIHFKWEASGDRRGRELRVRVDGVDLLEMIRQVEGPMAEESGEGDLVAAYAGLDDGISSLSRHFLGDPDPHYAHDGLTEILVCGGCHEPGCWPLLVSIEVGDDFVQWHDVRQPHRPHWSYRSLPELTFPKTQYLEALAEAG